MVTPTPRKVLASALERLLPRGWRLADSGRVVDNVPNTTVRLQQLAVRKLAEAPRGFHEIDVRATITAPGEHTQAAEDRLDRDLLQFILALEENKTKWTEATKVIADGRLGYDITLTILGSKE